MKRAAGAALALNLLASTPLPAVAQTLTGGEPKDNTMLLVGMGAVAGALAFNYLSAPLGIVPFAGGVLEAVPESIALGSRMVAVLTAGAGATTGLWLYDQWTGERSDVGYILSLLAGATAGVAVANFVNAGTLGVLPLEAATEGATTMVSSTAQAASRLYVVGSAVIGTWAAHWLYRR